MVHLLANSLYKLAFTLDTDFNFYKKHMKTIIKLTIPLLVVAGSACKKQTLAPSTQPATETKTEENFGPYGKTSRWKSIGGDTLFEETLTLSHFSVEKGSPCNTHYYLQNISFWNCYDYTLDVSECVTKSDTLTCIDPDTNKKAIFKREK